MPGIVEPSKVPTALNYLLAPENGEKPYNRIDAAGDKPSRNYGAESHDMEIENLRGKEDSVSLDTAGFQFGVAPAKHQAFRVDADIEREYYPESAELIKKVTGATRVVFFDHTVRRRNPAEDGNSPQKRQPVLQVHVDQTAKASFARVHRHLPAEDASRLAAGRFQIINLWRPISHPAYDWPLALCDYRSVEQANLVPTDLIYPDRVGETMGVTYASGHKWKYLRGMRPEEYVLIKCFDSAEGVALLTPHTAFKDPSTPKDYPLRESIELRALVFYE